MNIYLIGMPGCGKSTIGKATAEKTGLPFIDADNIITEKQKMSINDIFAKHGEEYFRNLETEALRSVSTAENAIIATGGGAVLRQENIDIMKKTGKLIYINTPVETILSQADFSSRPLLKDNAAKIHALYDTRHPIYTSCADIVLDFNEDIVETLCSNSSLLIPNS